MKQPSAENGFVYVATGERYVREAAASAATLRVHHPHAHICLVTDQPRGPEFWDDLVVLAQPRFGFRDKLEMRRAPYLRCVFLDTDTTVVGSMEELFTVLARYDICGVQLSEGQDYVMDDGIPHAFPEMNSGVVGFRTGNGTEDFFARWAEFYDRFHAANQAGAYHYANVGDQKSLRAALWHSNVRHFSIGAEFNFIPFRTELVSRPVVVFHTRAIKGLPALAKRLNGRLGRRAYVPTLDAIAMDDPEVPESRRLAFATIKSVIRGFARKLLPRAWRDWLRAHGLLTGWRQTKRHESAAIGEEAKWKTNR